MDDAGEHEYRARVQRQLDVLDRRVRDLEILLELQLPPLDEDPRTLAHPPQPGTPATVDPLDP